MNVDGIEGLGAKDILVPEVDTMIDGKGTEQDPEVLRVMLDLTGRETGVVVLDNKASKSGNKEGSTVMRMRDDLIKRDSLVGGMLRHLDMERACEVGWFPADVLMC